MPNLEGSDDLYDYFTLWKEAERPRREVEWMEQLLTELLEMSPALRDVDPIQRYLETGLEQARQAVHQLEREIYVRSKLHEQSVEQLDYQIACAAHSLKQFRGWSVGYNRGVDEKRIEEALKRIDKWLHTSD